MSNLYMYYGEKSYLLQTQDLRVGQANESCIRVNTRKLNRELCIDLSILYTKTNSLCSITLAYSK